MVACCAGSPRRPPPPIVCPSAPRLDARSSRSVAAWFVGHHRQPYPGFGEKAPESWGDGGSDDLPTSPSSRVAWHHVAGRPSDTLACRTGADTRWTPQSEDTTDDAH